MTISPVQSPLPFASDHPKVGGMGRVGPPGESGRKTGRVGSEVGGRVGGFPGGRLPSRRGVRGGAKRRAGEAQEGSRAEIGRQASGHRSPRET